MGDGWHSDITSPDGWVFLCCVGELVFICGGRVGWGIVDGVFVYDSIDVWVVDLILREVMGEDIEVHGFGGIFLVEGRGTEMTPYMF
jgi:hypothetical protein